ncbi:MAG: hypothetical protein ABJI96_06315 [Paracoccaceae bacterium]
MTQEAELFHTVEAGFIVSFKHPSNGWKAVWYPVGSVGIAGSGAQ